MNIKIYDNGGKTTDRYTVLFMNDKTVDYAGRTFYSSLNMNSNPSGVYGFCQHSQACDGKHLGKRIKIETLPIEVQQRLFEELA